mmetsp:Transcript_4212/g.10935  ORF Transcript_4212/g.10935 Transcript_4212/m.10935 type:complete len:202 (-) Transcript_4212:303-908(-)
MVDAAEVESGTDVARVMGEMAIADTTEGEKEDETRIDISNIVYRNVFKRDKDEETTKAVMQLWDDELDEEISKALKANRIPFISVVAFEGDKAIGVSTMTMEASPALWVKIGFFRCLVRKEYRRNGIATQLAIECKKALAEWSEANPGENLKAMGTYTHKNLLKEKTKQPVCEKTGLTLVGYNAAGLQIRLAWLDNARLKH